MLSLSKNMSNYRGKFIPLLRESHTQRHNYVKQYIVMVEFSENFAIMLE